jgi:hypothetical protein
VAATDVRPPPAYQPGPDGNVRDLANFEGAAHMINPDIRFALGREREKTLLAEAETARQVRQARLHRQQASAPGTRRSPPRRRPAWLQPGRIRLLGHWPRSA